jgi:hypothetical protein
LLVLAALTSAVLLADPAAAASPRTTLTIKIQPASGRAKVAWLTCGPAFGTHRHATAACAALADADGDPAAILPGEGVCTMQYEPVTLTVRGSWNGHLVDYRKTHGNACSMHLATGPVGQV